MVSRRRRSLIEETSIGDWGSKNSPSGSITADSRIGRGSNSRMEPWSANSSGEEDLSGGNGDDGKNEDNVFHHFD